MMDKHPQRRVLRVHMSDESTAAPLESVEGCERRRRPGRRARSRAKTDLYFRCMRSGEEGRSITMPAEALCAILEDGLDEGSEGDGEDWAIQAGRVFEQEMENDFEADSTLGESISDELEDSQTSRVEAKGNSTERFLSTAEMEYALKEPNCSGVGEQVWQHIPRDALNILQRYNYYEPFREKPKERSAVLLEAVLEAIAGRLQEPCRTPAIGDSGRAWDTLAGCELIKALMSNLKDEGAFSSTMAELEKKTAALEKLADGALCDFSMPPAMLAYGVTVHNLKVCVQRSRAWRWGSSSATGEDPEVLSMLGKGGPRKDSTRASDTAAGRLSSDDLQKLLQARLQASRRS